MSRTAVRALGAALAVALVAACNDDRAQITDPVGEVYNATLARVAQNIPRGTVARVTAGVEGARSITVTLQGLEALESANYHVWLATQTGTDTSNTVAATGRLRIIVTDTIIDAQGDPVPQPDTTTRLGAYQFNEGGGDVTIQLRVDSASLAAAGAAVTNPAAYNLVFVTIEPTPVTSPSASAPAPLWSRLTAASNPVRFGNFAPNPADEYVFTPAGRGIIGVWGNILVVDDSSLALPPEGYYYATALLRENAIAGGVDTTFFDLGPQKAPFPRRDVSLRDADVDQTIDETILTFPPSIRAASERVRIDTIPNAMLDASQPFLNFKDVRVTLEAKAGIAAPSPTVILLANFPEIVSRPVD